MDHRDDRERRPHGLLRRRAHSTGGVGDKITLPLAPLVAACGAAVPQLSGRGLGHTGGTLDKLESIPGWRASLSDAEMKQVLRDVGAVICAAGEGLAPADRKLYALRDVTGTVEAIPLIASSIMSKKIAEGTGSLVLDVKVGSGAFMKDADRAETLARTMVAITLAREMLDAAGVVGPDPADVLADGRAMDAWRRMIAAQGGDPEAPLPVARETQVLTAPRSGVLTHLDAMAVGKCAWRLGAGRARKEDVVSFGAGVEMHAKPGDLVTVGAPLMTLHADEPVRFAIALEALDGGWAIADEGTPVSRMPLVLARIGA